MKGPPLGPGGVDITWPDQVAAPGPKGVYYLQNQTSNLKPILWWRSFPLHLNKICQLHAAQTDNTETPCSVMRTQARKCNGYTHA